MWRRSCLAGNLRVSNMWYVLYRSRVTIRELYAYFGSNIQRNTLHSIAPTSPLVGVTLVGALYCTPTAYVRKCAAIDGGEEGCSDAVWM